MPDAPNEQEQRIPMTVIPKPAEGTRAVFVFREAQPGVPPVQGPSEQGLTFLCGQCSRPLLANLEIGMMNNIVINCPFCGAYNDIPRN
jgi:hypothetical protein